MTGRGHRTSRRTVRRRKRKLAAVVVAVVVSLAAGWLAVWLVDRFSAGRDYLQREKLVTGNSGRKYTVGGAVDRVIEKSREADDGGNGAD